MSGDYSTDSDLLIENAEGILIGDNLDLLDDTTIIPIINSTILPLVNKSLWTTLAPEVVKTTTASAMTFEEKYDDLRASVDTFFILINSFIIFFLQGGFAFLEAGSVRAKNTTNILIKNILDCFLGALAFWVVGFMIANSKGNSFMGFDTSYICLYNVDESQCVLWFFGFVFCATASTIVSGAVAERCELTAYFVYSTVVSGLIYPVCVHWAWSDEGWLRVNGYYDFAGSGVVHHLGGVCALMGAIFLGPRIGRFDDPKKPISENIPGHSVSLAALGAFILFFGFFSFNGATNGSISTEDDRNVVCLAVVNTIIGGMSSGFTTLLAFRATYHKKWSLLSTINGALCGMIATCAFCNVAEPWTTFIVGIFASACYIFIHKTMIWFRIDDPLDAVAVHSGGGMCGVLAAPFVIGTGGVFDPDAQVTAMHQIWSQLVGLLLITAWSASTCSLVFFMLKLNNSLRLPREVELAGCDVIKHGEAAYPPDAYLDANAKITKQVAQVEAFEIPDRLPEKALGSLKKKLNRSILRDKGVPVTPLAFKKLRPDSLTSESESESSLKVDDIKTQVLSGVTNNAFEDSVDGNVTYQETHFDEPIKDVELDEEPGSLQ